MNLDKYRRLLAAIAELPLRMAAVETAVVSVQQTLGRLQTAPRFVPYLWLSGMQVMTPAVASFEPEPEPDALDARRWPAMRAPELRPWQSGCPLLASVALPPGWKVFDYSNRSVGNSGSLEFTSHRLTRVDSWALVGTSSVRISGILVGTDVIDGSGLFGGPIRPSLDVGMVLRFDIAEVLP